MGRSRGGGWGAEQLLWRQQTHSWRLCGFVALLLCVWASHTESSRPTPTECVGVFLSAHVWC